MPPARRIAVDAMGGDHAPSAIVDGAVSAARELGIGVALVGATPLIEQALGAHAGWRDLGLEIVEAPEVIGMEEPPAASLRRKPGASIRVAAGMVADGRADALFSAGNTGAAVMAAHAAFGMIRGVDRPALGAVVPTRERPAVLLDVGANAECRPQHLVHFAFMGGMYARLALGVERPRIGLLSIGEEATKGNELTREAHRLLAASPIDFVGNVEARDLYRGLADVIVCDGFTGNVVLKVSEGLIETVEAVLGHELQGAFDYSEYGGAPLLGVGGLTVVGHGRSSPKAVRNAIAMADRFARFDFIRRVEQEIAAAHVSPR